MALVCSVGVWKSSLLCGPQRAGSSSSSLARPASRACSRITPPKHLQVVAECRSSRGDDEVTGLEVRRRSALVLPAAMLTLPAAMLLNPAAPQAQAAFGFGNNNDANKVVDNPCVEYQVQTPSSPQALEVAAKLQTLGAKLYGAFWCIDCQRQKETLGKEAYAMIEFVECYPNGVRKNVEGKPDILTPVETCSTPYDTWPMWVIPKQRGEGEDLFTGAKTIDELEKILKKYKF